jgi:hypothetical protein
MIFSVHLKQNKKKNQRLKVMLDEQLQKCKNKYARALKYLARDCYQTTHRCYAAKPDYILSSKTKPELTTQLMVLQTVTLSRV